MTFLPPSMEGRVLVQPQLCAAIVFRSYHAEYDATALTVYFEMPILLELPPTQAPVLANS